MDLSALGDLVARLATLAKEMGKGGGGSTEDPTVCMALLPIGLGVVGVGVQALRRRMRTATR
ncbi:MAG TPA: hypothetical protein VFA49_02475 [Chloroflexota bacterium]|jgi:hypothetical protein|nr:hypothetical protein [Chloroflexota bacterium]